MLNLRRKPNKFLQSPRIKIGLALSSLVMFLCSTFSLTGCWNKREIDEIAIVTGVGIDQAQEPDKVMITAQIIKPADIAPPGSGGGSNEKPYLNITQTGEMCFEIFRRFTQVINRRLYLSHNEVIIFGDELARNGVQGCVDLLFRDAEPRLTAWVLVAKGEAREVFDTVAELEKIPALNISQLIKAQASTSEFMAVNLSLFFQRLMSKTTAPLASLIEVQGEGKEKKARLVGTAVFKHDQMVGHLTLTESRGLLWVINEIKSGIIVAESPKGKGKVSLEILRAKGKIIPGLKGGKPCFTVEVKEEGNLGEQEGEQFLAIPGAWEALEKKQAEVIRREILAALQKAQSLKVDIFGFGEAFYRKYPDLWKELESDWDEIFPQVEVQIAVEAKLRQSGMITKPATPKAAG